MKNTIVHDEGAAALEDAVHRIKLSGSMIKIGLDVHARLYVAVAQYDQLLPKPAPRLAPLEFVPWVKQLLRAGHTVHVVYEACGFGFGLYRELQATGAHCYVIAPRKLDEQCTRVKTDPRDATTLCQRLSRYLDGNTRELASHSSNLLKGRNKPGMFHGNANSWFVFARSWKPRDAVCWLITVYPHQPTGGR